LIYLMPHGPDGRWHSANALIIPPSKLIQGWKSAEVSRYLPRKKENEWQRITEEDKEDLWWEEVLKNIDSSRFSKLFRDIVLITGLLRLREGGQAAIDDLETIMKETDKYSRRIGSARSRHPEAKILGQLEGNLTEFSNRTDTFYKALLASALRGELELLSLSLLLSRSSSRESRALRVRFANRLVRLARKIKLGEEELKKVSIPSSASPAPCEDHKEEKRE
jgi:hypothetical protein